MLSLCPGGRCGSEARGGIRRGRVLGSIARWPVRCGEARGHGAASRWKAQSREACPEWVTLVLVSWRAGWTVGGGQRATSSSAPMSSVSCSPRQPASRWPRLWLLTSLQQHDTRLRLHIPLHCAHQLSTHPLKRLRYLAWAALALPLQGGSSYVFVPPLGASGSRAGQGFLDSLPSPTRPRLTLPGTTREYGRRPPPPPRPHTHTDASTGSTRPSSRATAWPRSPGTRPRI